ncbi:glycosyltransferase family 39 protein [Sphingomonas oryzagri]
MQQLRHHRIWMVLPCVIAILAGIVGIALRIVHIGSYPLWLDEAYSAFAARQDFNFLWHVVPQYETHPPFYYSLLHVWRSVFGGSVLSLRLPGLICGIAVIPVIAWAGAALGRIGGFDRTGRIWMASAAATFAALQPLGIAMSHQVRPYPVMMLVYAAAIVALLELAIARPRQSLPRRWLALFFVTQAMMFWLHTLGALYGLALGLAVLLLVLRRNLSRADWAWLLIGELLVGIVYFPAFLIALQQQRTWSQSTWLKFDPAGVPLTLGFIYMTWNRWTRLIAVIGIVAGAIVLIRRRGGWRAGFALLLLALLPTALSLLLSVVKTPVFLDRTLSPVALAGFVLMSAAFGPNPRWRLAASSLAFYALVSSVNVDLFIMKERPTQDWYATVEWLAPRVRPGDVVWAYPNEGGLPLEQAFADRHEPVAVRQIPGPVPYFGPLGRHVTGSRGTVSMSPAEIEAFLDRSDARTPRTIWLMRLTAELYDPRGDMVHALAARRKPIAHFQYGAIDIVGFRRTDLPPVAPGQQAQP